MDKVNTQYFYLTPAKNWKLVDAIDSFDKDKTYNSFYELLLDLSTTLNQIHTTQSSLRKYVKAMENEVLKLLKLNIYTKEAPLLNQENIALTAQDVSSTSQELAAETQDNSNIGKLCDVLNNHGQVNVRPNHATFTLGKRQADEINDDDTCITLPNPLPRNAIPSEFEIAEGSSNFHLSSPSVHFEHPHKPKLRRLQISNLIELFHFGTSFSKSSTITNAEYLANEEDQKRNKCIKSLHMLDHLIYLLEEVSYDKFNATLWTKNVDDLDRRSYIFLDIVRYTLCSFHLIAKTVPEFMNNHERTYFVENIIPSLLSLAKNTGFIEFKWCETEFRSTKTLNLADYDYDLRGAPPSKNIDALGILSTQNNMELIVVESSSGRLKEHTTHTIENVLKILECGVAALKKEAIHYKNASLDTFKKLKVYSVQIIKMQVTLSELSLFNESHWKFVEKRSAKLPSNWNDRLEMIQYLELLATLFEGVLNTQLIQKELVKENLGLVSTSGPTIGSISKASCFNSHDFNHIIRHSQ